MPSKIFYINYKEVLSNPTIKFAERMLKKAKGATKVVSVGGGSSIDTAKYISFYLKIPHKAIPTTAGTGSEATKFAVFIKDGKKISLEDEKLIPEEYELNPKLVVSCPSEVTASSGLDALSQAIESYWSPNATKESKEFSRTSFELTMEYLLLSYKNPKNETFRMKMLEAAHFSGKAINITRTSICHAISYYLTINYGVPHGIACVSTLPIFMKLFNFKQIPYKEVENLIKNLNVDIVPILKRIDKDVVEEAFESSRASNIPLKLTEKDICKLLCQ